MDEHTNFTMAINEAAEHRRIAAERLAEATRRLRAADELARESRRQGFSIVRAIKCMTTDGDGGLRSGIEAEVAQECARIAGLHYDANRPTLPWRTLIAGAGANGGYTVDGTGIPTVGDALAPWSITMRAGLTVLPGLVGDVQIPREGAGAEAQWLATEITAGTAAELTVGAASLQPKTALGYMELSRQLLRQGPAADPLVARSLGRAIATLVDKAIVAGTSTDASVPLGIRYQTGVTVTVGTGLTHSNLLNEQEQVALANVQDGAHAFVGHPTVRELLGARAVGTSAGMPPFMWQDDKILNRPAYATIDVGTGRIVHGDWSQVVFASWGAGFQLEHNPYANFPAGVVGVRAVISCDIGLMQPAAMRVVEGIT